MTTRGLSGDFETMPMRDLIGFLASRAVSGVLTLEKEGTKKQLHLEGGSIINASSNLPREFLGQFLINLGHITEEQFTKAWETQQETKVFLGRILVMIGLVTEDVVVAALATKFRETLQEAFDWTSGTFAFAPGLPPPPSEGLDVRVSLTDVYKDAEVRAKAWERIRSVFPSPRCTLEVREEFLELTPADGSIDLKLLAGIDTGKTIEELALGLHATDFVLYQRLYALHAMGAISVRPPREEPEPELTADVELGERPTPERLLESARGLFSQARYRDAYALARRAKQLEATPASALLLKQIETAWLPGLRAELLGRARRPSSTLAGEALSALPLTAAERYLLSRVDGERTLEAIVRVAPLGEFEALSAFDRFLAQGWISR